MGKIVLAPGKLKGLIKLADSEGKFRMLAIDQRGSLQSMLAKAAGKNKEKIGYNDMALTKRLVTEYLSPYFSATLMDPQFGVPESLKYLDRNSALLIAREKSGTEYTGYKNNEKKTVLLDEWNIEKIKRAGADAAKLLLYYRTDNTEEVKGYQENIVKKVGEECKKYDLPFVLEPVGYAFKDDEPSTDSPAFASKKPEIVLNIAREFSKEEYGVDILKLEFPVNLKFVEEFHNGYFDGKQRKAVYTLKDTEDACYEITKVSRVPWVILSAGVGMEEFIYNVEIASKEGASGFLAGRAVWKDFTKYFPNESDMAAWLKTSGVANYYKLYEASKKAVPFYEHQQFVSFAGISIKDAGEDWYKTF